MHVNASKPRAAGSPVHAIATIGNAVFLAFLIMVLSHDRLFLPTVPASMADAYPSVEQPDKPNTRALLVMIDGLRADTAADAGIMPNLAKLAQRGWFVTARVDSLIPSTLSGIVSLTTGVTSPAAHTLQDFRALAAHEGGLFEQVHAAGGRSFVAGSQIWFDLYGRWIDNGAALDSLVHGDDLISVESAERAIESNQYQFIVLHLGAPDDAAHVHGTQSPEYQAAVRGSDSSLRRLFTLMRPDDLVVVTADHGNTAAGGHAGPEDDVLNVPVVVAGTGHSGTAIAVRRQAEVAPFIAASLGLRWVRSTPPAAPGPAIPVIVAALCGAAVLWTISGVDAQPLNRVKPTMLHAAVWAVLPLAAVAGRYGAIVTALCALALAAACHWRSSPGYPLVAGCGVGVVLAALRLADGIGPTWTSTRLRDASLIIAILVAYLVGRRMGACLRANPARAMAFGVATGVCCSVVGRIAGQTLSLSTLDVRWAYSLATSEATIGLAALIVALLHISPVLAVLAGIRPTLRQASPHVLLPFAAGLGSVYLGQLLMMSIALCTTTFAALATGGLLRIAAEHVSSFMSLAAASLASHLRRPRRAVRFSRRLCFDVLRSRRPSSATVARRNGR